MAFRDAFIIRTRVVTPAAAAEKGAALAASDSKTPAPAPIQSGQGVFLSAQSLVSFPVATAVVTFLWKLYLHFLPNSHDAVVLWISLAIGLLIFLISTSDPTSQPKDRRSWIIAIAIALVNSLFLAASSLGLVAGVLGR